METLREIAAISVKFSEMARRKGLLALEDFLENIEDPLYKKALTLVIDGTDPALIRYILEFEGNQREFRNTVKKEALLALREGKKLYQMLTPDDPIIKGIIQEVSEMSPETRDSMLAGLPFEEAYQDLREEVIREGASAIQAGHNPRMIAIEMASLLGLSEEELFSTKIPWLSKGKKQKKEGGKDSRKK